jgi:hypothetical protein
MSLIETADQINALFREYGLSHDVVFIAPVPPKPKPDIVLDERENEPDPAKWRTRVPVSEVGQALMLVESDNESAMSLLLETLKFIFQVYFEVQPSTGQGRLF